MRKVVKNVIKISIVMLFILLGFYINANSSYALTANEAKEIKAGDSLEVTTKSKIYLYGSPSGLGVERIYAADDYPNITGVEKGTRIKVGTPLTASGKAKKVGDKYYVPVNYEHISCYVHYSNLKIRTVSEEEKDKIEKFINKQIVQDILMGKANDYHGNQNRLYSDEELIDILSEAKKLNLETGNDKVKKVLMETEEALEARGYDVKTNNDGSLSVVDKDGNIVETTEGGDQEVSNDTIFYQPSKVTSGDSSEEDLDDLITDAESFLESAEADGVGVLETTNLQNFSKSLYNILLAVGIVVAVIVGALLGIKLMVSSVEEKAEVIKLIMPYVVGCIVIFGGFTIWKILVEILSNV